jgi:tetratricopeptide (TPR) repeat protein
MQFNLKHLLYLIPTLLLASCEKKAADEAAQVSSSEVPNTFKTINALIEQQPDNPDLYYVRGEYFYEMNGFDEAIADYNKAIQLDSAQSRYWHSLSNVYLDYYREKSALQTMEMASFLFPDSIITQLKLAETYLILKNHEKALNVVSKVKNFNPNNDEVHYLAGLIFADNGELDMAISNMQTCVELNSRHIEAWYELGNLWNIKGSGNDPILYYDNALRVDSMYTDALFSKAQTLYKQGKFGPCIDTYNSMGRMFPSDESSFFNAGVVMVELNDYQNAWDKFNICVELNPALVQAYYYRGLCDLELGNTAAGKADLEQALRFDPDYEKAKLLLSNIQ